MAVNRRFESAQSDGASVQYFIVGLVRPAGKIIAAVIARPSLRAISCRRNSRRRQAYLRRSAYRAAPSPRRGLVLCRHNSDMKRLIQMLPQLGGSVPPEKKTSKT
jgi:hypothetical protein